MFSRKKKAPPPRKKERSTSTFEIGLGIPGVSSNQEENDSDLEAELFALTGEKSVGDDLTAGGSEDDDLEAELARIIGKGSKNEHASVSTKTVKEVSDISTVNIEVSDNDDDIDENDPELLTELRMLTVLDSEVVEEKPGSEEIVEDVKEKLSQVDLIKQRLSMYKTAESNAKAINETSRARRFSRGIKTLEQLLRKAQNGDFVPYNEIPPEIATNLKPSAPIIQAPVGSTLNTSNSNLKPNDVLGLVHDNNSSHSVDSKDSNSKPVPNTISNEEDIFECLVPDDSNEELQQRNENNEPKNQKLEFISNDPVNPTVNQESMCENPTLGLITKRKDDFRKLALIAKKSGDLNLALEHMRSAKTCEKLVALFESGKVVNEQDIPKVPGQEKKPSSIRETVQKSAPSGVPRLMGEVFTAPKTVQEALAQRLHYYTKALEKIESVGPRNEAQKVKNIIKIYQNAIKLHSKGGEVPFQKLPTPPGCPPIPLTFKLR